MLSYHWRWPFTLLRSNPKDHDDDTTIWREPASFLWNLGRSSVSYMLEIKKRWHCMLSFLSKSTWKLKKHWIICIDSSRTLGDSYQKMDKQQRFPSVVYPWLEAMKLILFHVSKSSWESEMRQNTWCHVKEKPILFLFVSTIFIVRSKSNVKYLRKGKSVTIV